MRFKPIRAFMLFLGVLVLLAHSINAEVAGTDFKLLFSTSYCNCDSDCDHPKGCVTKATDNFITALSDRTEAKIDDARQQGYNGVCASMLMSNEPSEWPMTQSCELQFDCVKNSDCESGFECVSKECIEIPPDCTKDADCRSGYECNSGECKEKENYCSKDGDCDAGYECVNRECTKKKQQNTTSRVVKIDVSDSNQSKNTAPKTSFKLNTGGIDMDVVSVTIVSATIILMGFFGLMAWTAYLLQKKVQHK